MGEDSNAHQAGVRRLHAHARSLGSKCSHCLRHCFLLSGRANGMVALLQAAEEI